MLTDGGVLEEKEEKTTLYDIIIGNTKTDVI